MHGLFEEKYIYSIVPWIIKCIMAYVSSVSVKYTGIVTLLTNYNILI